MNFDFLGASIEQIKGTLAEHEKRGPLAKIQVDGLKVLESTDPDAGASLNEGIMPNEDQIQAVSEKVGCSVGVVKSMYRSVLRERSTAIHAATIGNRDVSIADYKVLFYR